MIQEQQYDVIIIGAGPAGYEAALELGNQGCSVCLIDRDIQRLGGTCLNEGCIPAKNYLESAHHYSSLKTLSLRGITIQNPTFSLSGLRQSTRSLIQELQKGIEGMLKRARVQMLLGEGSFVDSHTVKVNGEDGETVCKADHIIIATGSKVRSLDVLPVDGKSIIDSSGVFALEALPKSIAIVGGGAIGCEFATFFHAFGVEVTLIEYLSTLIPAEDEDVAKALQREFTKKGIVLKCGVGVEESKTTASGVTLALSNGESLEVEKVLVAAGRIPNTDHLNPEKAGIATEKGFVTIDESFRTSQPHIYAIGDVVPTLAYAHTAYKEAKVVAYNISNKTNSINDRLSPSVTFCHPQVASIGLKEKEAKEKNLPVTTQKLFFKSSGKAKIYGDDSGFLKLIVEKESGMLLGASIIGADATELIHELLVAVESKRSVKEIGDLIHAHPTLSESIGMLAHMMVK